MVASRRSAVIRTSGTVIQSHLITVPEVRMTADLRVMHGPARQHLRQRMADEFADPQLTLREHLARAGIALMPSAGHGRPCMVFMPGLIRAPVVLRRRSR